MDLYQQIFFTTLAISFGILHLILFLYNRSFKSNLFFTIFLFLYALNIFFDFQASLTGRTEEALFYLRLHRFVMPYNSVFALLFTYYAFQVKIPKHFWFIVAGLAITGFFAVLKPIKNLNYVQIAQAAVLVETIRIFISAFKSKRYDTWIIASGFALLFLFSMYDMLLDLNLMNPIYNIENGYQFGFLFLIISVSIYLARDFARVNGIILTKEREAREMEIAQKLLEAENARQSKELEEARQLQISMLPKDLPKLPHLEIGVYMKTATEVGGDYYDFKLHDDGTLTVVIGDATGHGMQAGTMVSATKSLFHALADEPAPIQFLNKGTKAIYSMGLKKMFMALTIAKFKDHQMHVASAGMPFPLIYRSSTHQVEEVVLKGMPLGGFADFPYQDKKLNLSIGDTVFFASDGLEEMFNPQNETLGKEQVKMLFRDIAEKSSEEIIDHLKKAGESWANGRDQADDVTFVVFKIK